MAVEARVETHRNPGSGQLQDHDAIDGKRDIGGSLPCPARRVEGNDYEGRLIPLTLDR